MAPKRLATDKSAEVAKHLPEFVGQVFTQDLLRQFAAVVAHAAMPRAKNLNEAQTTALLASMQHMLGGTFDENVLLRNGQRLLANWSFIKDGSSIPIWTGGNITADVIILGVSPLASASTDQRRYIVKMRLKNGLGAGIISCACLYETAMQMFLDRYSGCRKYNCAPEEISGMEARVLVSYEDDRFKIHAWDATQKQKEHNKELCEFRCNPRKCKHGGTWCNTCKCTTDECSLAVWLPKEKEI